MITMTISDKFNKFAAKTTRGKFDEARKAESAAGGCPIPVGVTGKAVIADIIGSMTADKDGVPGHPIVTLKLTVETPDEYQGQHLSGFGLKFWIKDSAKRTEVEAWQSMLDSLEELGLPREIREGYESFEEVVEWFKEAPRFVTYVVNDNTYNGKPGKSVSAYMYSEASQETIAGSEDADGFVMDPEADYVDYLGKPHKILSADDSTYNLESPLGKVRNGIPKNKTKPLS